MRTVKTRISLGILVFAGHTLSLLVLSCRSSFILKDPSYTRLLVRHKMKEIIVKVFQRHFDRKGGVFFHLFGTASRMTVSKESNTYSPTCNKLECHSLLNSLTVPCRLVKYEYNSLVYRTTFHKLPLDLYHAIGDVSPCIVYYKGILI